MKTYKIEEISEIVGGILTKVTDASIDKLRPPLLADENALALAWSEEEIENIDKEKNEKEEENLVENAETVQSVEQYKKKFDFNSIFEAIGQFWKVCKAKVLKIVKNEKLLAEKTGKGEK